MASEFKKIVLLKGLQVMEDYQFRAIKSLLRKELKLTKKMQDEYDRIQMADLMEDKFIKDAGLAKLIELCKDVEELKEIAEKLKTEKEKVKNQKGKKGKSVARKRKQDEPSSFQIFSTSNESISSKNKIEQPRKTEAGKKRKLTQKKTQLPELLETNIQKYEGCFQALYKPPPIPSGSSPNKTPNPSITRGDVVQNDDMTVMVLNSTHPFEYESSEHGRKTMFHAKVATAKQYYHVKVFNVSLREKFTKNNFIIISNFVKRKGILEINENSSVVEAGPDLKFEVPNSIIKRANETPKIRHIKKGASGALFYGLFTLIKKTVKVRNTIYEIKDNEENHIEVVGNGICYNINCKEGDKLQLYCFQLRTIDKQPKLVSGDHSFIEVMKPRGKKEIPTAHSSKKDEEKGCLQHQFCYFK